MIYEFLYNDKPLGIALPLVLFIGTCAFLALTLHGVYSKKSTNADKVFFSTVGLLVTILCGASFLISSAIYISDLHLRSRHNTKRKHENDGSL